MGRHAEDRKTIRHPRVGDIEVDCDVLVDAETELKVVAHTAAPGEDEVRLMRLTRPALAH